MTNPELKMHKMHDSNTGAICIDKFQVTQGGLLYKFYFFCQC